MFSSTQLSLTGLSPAASHPMLPHVSPALKMCVLWSAAGRRVQSCANLHKKIKEGRKMATRKGKALKLDWRDLPQLVRRCPPRSVLRGLLSFTVFRRTVFAVVTGAVRSCCFSRWWSAVMTRRRFSSRDPSTLSESVLLSSRSVELEWL